MNDYLNSLGDGWSIYLWLIAGGLIILAVIFWINWARKHEQFDEDIKYLVFDAEDRDKMSKEEFAKSQEVMAKQMARREELLKIETAKKEAKA